jgi:hypothetical protein
MNEDGQTKHVQKNAGKSRRTSNQWHEVEISLAPLQEFLTRLSNKNFGHTIHQLTSPDIN